MNCRIDPGDSHVAPPDQNDTDTRLDTKSPAADRPTETTETVAPTPADSPNGFSELPQLFAFEAKAQGDDLDDFVAAVTTIAQSWCERATDYAAIETLVCRLPIDQWTFAAHDVLAPYSGPYPMALLVRAFIIEEINGWDETALHDNLRAHPSLRRGLGFETLPDQFVPESGIYALQCSTPSKADFNGGRRATQPFHHFSRRILREDAHPE